MKDTVSVRTTIKIVLTLFVIGMILPIGTYCIGFQDMNNYSLVGHILGFIYLPMVFIPLIWYGEKRSVQVYAIGVTVISLVLLLI